MFDTLLKGVKRLADYELVDSKDKFEPQFHSLHEGYGVLAEEVDEARREARLTKAHFKGLLGEIRGANPSYVRSRLVNINGYALSTAAEYIQVAAMAQKMLEIAKEEKK